MFIPSRHGVDRRRRVRRLGSGSSPSSLRSVVAAMIMSSSASVASAARFQPKDRAELKAQVDKCLDADPTGQSTSAPACVAGCTGSTCDGMADWDVSLVTDMSFLFLDKSRKDDSGRKGTRNFKKFNANIGRWDVSKVITMKGMFWFNEKFNQDIGAWDVSKVTDMQSMFSSATAFDQDIGAWDVSSVTTMKKMFNYAYLFNGDISKWDVSKVTDMQSMFNNAKAFDHSLECWNDGAVENFKDTFDKAYAFWKTFKRRDGKTGSEGPPSAWISQKGATCCGVSAPTNGAMGTCGSELAHGGKCEPTCDAGYALSGTLSCYQGVLRDVKCNAPCDASGAIANGVPGSDCTSSLAHGSSCAPKCDAGYALMGTRSCTNGQLKDSASCQVPKRFKPKDRAELKAQVDKCLDADPTGQSTSAPACVAGCTGSTCDGMADWDVSLVTSMEVMFDGKKKFNGNIGRWDVSKVTTMRMMFHEAWKFNQDIGAWDVSSVTDMHGMFANAASFNKYLNDWNVSKVTNMSWMFFSRAGIQSSFNQCIGRWDVSSVTDMQRMFVSAKKFNQDISDWDVSKVTNMGWMFYDATYFNKEIAKWNVSSVTDMSYMFTMCVKFNRNIGWWDVSKVTNMEWMFAHTVDFNQDIGDWDVSSVTNMDNMFYYARWFNRDISDWDVSKVTRMTDMFTNARALSDSYKVNLPRLGAAADSSFSPPSFGAASALALAAVAGVSGFAIHKARRRPPASDEENTLLLKRGNYGALSA